ncbi:MAG: hydrogenase maturation nickel metallochaperone HypA [Spirochaetia bacterium]|nr:hydrogenase maturation nickel metallochaperone HypA [Spirochaetia bacterium]
MSGCGTCGDGTVGPFSEGKDLVEFVLQAHGGTVAVSPLPNGGLNTTCQGCGEEFVLKTFVDSCPKCGGVHAVSPPRCNDPANIQYAGKEFSIS